MWGFGERRLLLRLVDDVGGGLVPGDLLGCGKMGLGLLM